MASPPVEADSRSESPLDFDRYEVKHVENRPASEPAEPDPAMVERPAMDLAADLFERLFERDPPLTRSLLEALNRCSISPSCSAHQEPPQRLWRPIRRRSPPCRRPKTLSRGAAGPRSRICRAMILAANLGCFGIEMGSGFRKSNRVCRGPVRAFGRWVHIGLGDQCPRLDLTVYRRQTASWSRCVICARRS
jgi:hypothetical protein